MQCEETQAQLTETLFDIYLRINSMHDIVEMIEEKFEPSIIDGCENAVDPIGIKEITHTIDVMSKRLTSRLTDIKNKL
jgi:hypothetical protein